MSWFSKSIEIVIRQLTLPYQLCLIAGILLLSATAVTRTPALTASWGLAFIFLTLFDYCRHNRPGTIWFPRSDLSPEDWDQQRRRLKWYRYRPTPCMLWFVLALALFGFGALTLR